MAVGNAIKNGIPVTITGAPNTGKSTFLNHLLNEEKAIVSEILGTTRDFIEDTVIIDAKTGSGIHELRSLLGNISGIDQVAYENVIVSM